MNCPRRLATGFLGVTLALAMLLTGCASAPPPSPTAAPPKQEAPKPAESKPAAPAPTSAPAPTAVPAAKPAEATKPAAQPTAPPKPAAQPTAPAKSAVQPVQGGELIVGLMQEPASLDPTNANGMAQRPINALYDTLVVMADDFKFHPALAESWQASSDGKTYTFKLKAGVKFHDGTPFNAAAVKATLDHATRSDAKATYPIALHGLYEKTEVVDDLTARVVLTEPFAPFLDALSEGYHGMISPTALKKFGKDYDRNPVGTGPFIFQEWTANDHVAVRKNPEYNWGPKIYGHQGPPYLDKITFKLIPEATTRLATLETGEVHLIEEPSLQDMPMIEKDPRFAVVKSPYPGTSRFVRINVSRPPTDELAVRQALLYAIDQDAICKVIWQDIYPPSYSVLVRQTFAFDEDSDKMYRFNQAKAREILDAAGWKVGSGGVRQRDGKPLTMNIYANSGLPPSDLIAQIVQAQLKEIGMDVQIKLVARAVFTTDTAKGEHNLMLGARTSTDPDNLRPQYHSSTIGTELNGIRVKDPKLDALLEQGYRVLDPAERIKTYREVQQYIMKNALSFGIAQRINVTVFDKRKVNGVYVDIRTYPHFYDVWMTK